MPQKRSYRLRTVFPVLVLLVLIFAGTAIYFYWQASVLKNAPEETVDSKDEKVIKEVQKLMILPEGEMRTIATVSDPEALLGHPFFLHAEQGDKVLIFRPSGRIILFRPKAGKIVEAGILDAGEPFPVK